MPFSNLSVSSFRNYHVHEDILLQNGALLQRNLLKRKRQQLSGVIRN